MKNVWRWEVERLIQHVLGLTIYSTTDSHWLVRGAVNYTHYELEQVVGPTSSKHCYVANGPTYSKWSEDVSWNRNVIGKNHLDVYENSIAKRLLLCRIKCFSSVEQDRSCKMSISSNVRSPTVAWNQRRSLWSNSSKSTSYCCYRQSKCQVMVSI